MEHHDIKSLEQLWQASEGHRPSQHHKTSSSSSSASQRTTTFSAPKQENESNSSQSDALAGIGGDFELLEDFPKFDTTLDLQSPGGVEEEQRAQIPAPATLNFVAPNISVIDPNPYSSYQNGQMVAIGVKRNERYYCQHLDGLCQESFDEEELLLLHFEIFHFAFTRIDPAVRYICSRESCLVMNENDLGPCYRCGSHNSIEPWIYGHYIRIPSFHRHAPDGQPIQGYNAIQPPFSSYSFPSPNSQWDTDANGNFTDFNTPGNFTFPGGNAYDGSPYDYNASQGSDNGGGQSPANIFPGGRYSSRGSDYSPQVLCIGVQQKCHRQLYLALGLCIFALTTIGFADWIFPKARTAFIPSVNIHSHLPIVGFLGMLASFATCFSAKHLAGRRAQSVSTPPTSPAFHPNSNSS